VIELVINGIPVDPARKYSLAVSQYLATGHNNYDVLATQRQLVTEDLSPLETSAVIAYIEKRGQVSNRLEQRVVLVK
jgi:hypothetical protein